MAKSAGAKCFLVAGSIDAAVTTFDASASLSIIAGSAAAAMKDPLKLLASAGAELVLNTELSALEGGCEQKSKSR